MGANDAANCMGLSFVVYSLLLSFLRFIDLPSQLQIRLLSIMVLISAAYVSYSLGMNNVGNAIGPLLSKFPIAALI